MKLGGLRRRTWALIVTAIAAAATTFAATYWYVSEEKNEDVPIGPAPNLHYEHHMSSLALVVNNLRSTSVAIDITVDGRDFYSGTVAPNNKITTDAASVAWVDLMNATSHNHEAVIIITYDGLIHNDTVTLHPSGPYELPQTFSYTIA